MILAIQTLIVVAWRYILNGETSPDFIEAQNPAGFAKDRTTRALSVSWVYILYIRDALYPYYLCPDWSGRSIDLITNWKDPRAMGVVVLWYLSAQSLWTMIVGVKFPSSQPQSSSSSTDNPNDNKTQLVERNQETNYQKIGGGMKRHYDKSICQYGHFVFHHSYCRVTYWWLLD